MRACRTCGGTGNIYRLRSMFATDGYRPVRCGICGGTGDSPYNDDPAYVRFQKRAREHVRAWGGLKPPTTPTGG